MAKEFKQPKAIYTKCYICKKQILKSKAHMYKYDATKVVPVCDEHKGDK